MLNAVLESCEFLDESDRKKFGAHQLRLAVINHIIDQRELLFDEFAEDIKYCYGAFEDTESGNGGYSFKTYLKRMMKNGEWCDTIMIKAIASMWSVRISVIYANNFTQVKFRHDVAACQADIVLLYNGHYVHGHYIATVHAAGDNFLIGRVHKDEVGYDRDTDKMERQHRSDFDWQEEGDNAMVTIPLDSYNALTSKYGTEGVTLIGKREYDILLRKAEMYDKIKKVYDEGGNIEETLTGDAQNIPLPSLGGNTGDKSGAGSKRKSNGGGEDDDNNSQDDNGSTRRPDDPTIRKKKVGRFEGEKEFQDTELENTTICPRCHIDLKTRGRFDTHIKKFHKDIFNHLCRKCDRGFITLDGYTKHKLQHDKKAEKIKCDEAGCNSEFATKDSFKNHKRKYHPVGGIKLQKCRFNRIGCTQSFKTKSNRLQHEAGCPFNPNRVELKCEICQRGKFWLLNKLQEHKRSKHNWR